MHTMVPRLLSVNAGFMDTAAFLALKGLFTAHVTGNFVTLGAALVMGSSGVLAKLLALPVFCLVVLAVHLFAHGLRARSRPVARWLLATQLVLMVVGAILAAAFGPFASADGGAALATGMTLVAAMAIQNAAHRVHFAHAPPSTVMTGTTTQIMMDLGDLVHGVVPERAAATRQRLRQMSLSVLAFASGCALGALLFAFFGVWCFWVPPVLLIITLVLPETPIEATTG
jgi:uncharacterized membrane protein YoaK (UPF0700 family)